MKKKKMISLAVVIACICTCFGSTAAYFTTKDTARNAISTGSIGIQIVEKTQEKDGILIDYPKDGIRGVVPGTKVSKIVSVGNTGEDQAWIRVRIETVMKNSDGEALPLTQTIGEKEIPMMDLTIEKGWILGNDGYYYYEEPVLAGKKTGVLFQEVSFAAEMPNAYQNCMASIEITADAVQAAHNPIPKGGSVLDISGWAKH